MNREQVQREIVEVLARHGLGDLSGLLADMEVDKPEGGETGKLAYYNAERQQRTKLRVGKWVRKFFGEGRSDHDIQKIGSDIVAALWAGSGGDGDENGVVELRGEKLRDFYLQSVSGIPSCMAYDSAQCYLDIYVDNPDKVSLATVRIDGDAARALVWTAPGGQRYMDRIYHTSDACKAALEGYARNRNIFSRADLFSMTDRIEMKICSGSDSFWPYMDTLFYVNIHSPSMCSLSSKHGEYEAQDTDGGLCMLEDRHYCCDCGDEVYDDQVYSNEDGDEYCESCYFNTYTSCERCGLETTCDDVVTVHNGDCDCYVCEGCADRCYSRCEYCHEYYNSDLTSGDCDGNIVCDSCYEEHCTECEECGAVIKLDNIVRDPDGRGLCNDCFGESYAYCNECDDPFSKDVLVDGFCPDCAVEHMVKECTNAG